MSIIWFILGILCLVYYIICVSYAGFGTAFAFVWAIASGAFFVLSVVFHLAKLGIILVPGRLKIAFWAVMATGIIVFLIFESCVISGMISKPEKDCEYVLVLGAQIRGTRITKSLARRLEAAYDYYLENPNVTIIVSGGQGKGEDMTEAQAMASYLIGKGIPRSQIILEDKSTDTNENILFSMQYIKNKDAKIAIASNNFHIFRAVHIARAKGLSNVCGIPAASDEILFINYCVRESIGVAKDWLFGNFSR